MLAPWKESYDQPRQRINKKTHYFAHKGPYTQSYDFSIAMSRCETWNIKKAEHEELMFSNCGVEDSWDSHGLQGDQTSQSYRKSTLNIHWKDWCWSSNTLATWCEELTHLKRLWCWERLKAGGEGDDRGWDGWMASPTQWTWVGASSGSWWWTGQPGKLQSMVSQRVGHNWATVLTDWPVFLPEKSHGQRTLVSYSPRGCKELDMAEPLSTAHFLY